MAPKSKKNSSQNWWVTFHWFFIDFSLIFHLQVNRNFDGFWLLLEWTSTQWEHWKIIKNHSKYWFLKVPPIWKRSKINKIIIKNCVRNYSKKTINFWSDFERKIDQKSIKIDEKSMKNRCKNRWEFRMGYGRGLRSILEGSGRVMGGFQEAWAENININYGIWAPLKGDKSPYIFIYK